MELDTPVNRYSEIRLSPELVASSRVVVPAMASSTATADGHATAATIAHYRRLAAAKPGVLFVEYSFVSWSGRSEPEQLGAAFPSHFAGLREIAAVIHAAGAIAGLQLTHAGGKTDRELTGGVLMSPNGIAVPVKDQILGTPEVMTDAEIAAWREAFVAAAARASAAGFRLIEIHAAHGYGFNQWLSPITNQRRDAYGLDLKGRTRLLLEVIAEIRRTSPELAISVRLPGQDHLPGGLTRETTLAIAKLLAAAGVAVINVSSGLGGWRRPRDRVGEGYLVAEAAFIQAGLNLPVIGVGGIETGHYIDAGLAKGHFSLAAVGRAILADPEGWREKNLTVHTNLKRINA